MVAVLTLMLCVRVPAENGAPHAVHEVHVLAYILSEEEGDVVENCQFHVLNSCGSLTSSFALLSRLLSRNHCERRKPWKLPLHDKVVHEVSANSGERPDRGIRMFPQV